MIRQKKLKKKTQDLSRKQEKMLRKQPKKINQRKKLQRKNWLIWRRRTKKKKEK